jgi:hypothetical protein
LTSIRKLKFLNPLSDERLDISAKIAKFL